MSKKEQLLELAENYEEASTAENLEAMKTFLKKETLYFTEYYSDPEGKHNVQLSGYRGSGKFIEFTVSAQFLQPSLLRVRTENDDKIIYLPFSNIVFE